MIFNLYYFEFLIYSCFHIILFSFCIRLLMNFQNAYYYVMTIWNFLRYYFIHLII